jgi:hypothetical protein
MIISNVVPFRQDDVGINKDIGGGVLQDIKKDAAQTQAGSHPRLYDLTTKNARSYNPNREGKTEKDFAIVYMKYGIDYLVQAGKTKAGKVLGYLIKNMRFGNIAHVSPTTISRETKIDLPNVSRYLTRLCGDRLIDRYKTDSGTHAFFITPRMCFKGNTEARRLAIRKWEKLSFKYTKEQLHKVQLKTSQAGLGRKRGETRPQT